MGDFLKIYAPMAIITFIGFVIAYQYVDPAPPAVVRIATGQADGAYALYGEQYADAMRAAGLDVELMPSGGSLDNLSMLTRGEVDIALVQGGVRPKTADAPQLVSLASVTFEPLWVFAKGDPAPVTLSDLDGKRLAVGGEGSGTREIVLRLLNQNGVGSNATEFWSVGGTEAARSLLTGQIDAAFFVAAEDSPAIQSLLRAPDIHLVSFNRAEAYQRLHPYLSSITLPQGILDLDRNIPRENVTLLAPAANLVARADIHPAVSDMLLQVAAKIHGSGGIFHPAGAFPNATYVDFPLSADAQRFFETGPTFLRRYLPYWAATLAERMFILLVPILGLMIPLARMAPPTYRWRVRRRIYRWYGDLRDIEKQIRRAETESDKQRSLDRLDELQEQTGRIGVPLAHANDLYQLREHVDFVKQLLRFKRPGSLGDRDGAFLLSAEAPALEAEAKKLARGKKSAAKGRKKRKEPVFEATEEIAEAQPEADPFADFPPPVEMANQKAD
jgi:TRAP transporter TAXI family solute receptor